MGDTTRHSPTSISRPFTERETIKLNSNQHVQHIIGTRPLPDRTVTEVLHSGVYSLVMKMAHNPHLTEQQALTVIHYKHPADYDINVQTNLVGHTPHEKVIYAGFAFDPATIYTTDTPPNARIVDNINSILTFSITANPHTPQWVLDMIELRDTKNR